MSTYRKLSKTGGKQVKVELVKQFNVEKFERWSGQEVTFNEVVLVGGETLLSELHLLLELL